MKKNNGITLIALILTIIVLIILAGISINALNNNGIFEKAKEAKDKWKNAQEDEELQIAKYSNEVEFFSRGSNSFKVTLLWEGTGSHGDTITYINNHNIDEFDSIKFLYYTTNESDNGWYQEPEYLVQTLNNLITNTKTLGLYGYGTRNVSLKNLTKTGFYITASELTLSAVYGINY